jgi:hypothetical protein
MIYLSRKDEFRKILLTLSMWNLKYIGVFKFFVRDKKIVKLQEAEVPRYCLYLSTETEDYGSTITVSRKRYDQAKLGKYYGLCGVIRNTRHDDFILITENTNPDTAVSQVVKKSWAKMLFVMIVLGLCMWSILIFIYPLLH